MSKHEKLAREAAKEICARHIVPFDEQDAIDIHAAIAKSHEPAAQPQRSEYESAAVNSDQGRCEPNTQNKVPAGSCAPTGWKWYLVGYDYNDSKWSLDILATDDEDARGRVEALFNAKLLGKRIMQIPAFTGAGIIAKVLCSVRNFLWK
jgi:hypothetical protein